MFALNFPGIDEIVKWPALFGDGFYAFNKIALISLLAVLIWAPLPLAIRPR